MGTGLAETRKAIDFSINATANEYYKEIISRQAGDGSDVDKKYGQEDEGRKFAESNLSRWYAGHHNTLMQHFRDVTNVYKRRVVECARAAEGRSEAEGGRKPVLPIVDYIRHYFEEKKQEGKGGRGEQGATGLEFLREELSLWVARCCVALCCVVVCCRLYYVCLGVGLGGARC